MSTEIAELNCVNGTTNLTQYSGGDKGLMIKITQGVDKYIQLTRDEAAMLTVLLESWIKDTPQTTRMYFKYGDRVHYTSPYNSKLALNGIVKDVRNDLVFVVYHCDNDWDNFENYTAAATSSKDLQRGWV